MLALLLVLVAASCGGDRESDTPKHAPTFRHLLVVTLDTTRADRLGCYGADPNLTPVIDARARSGVVFERAYTTVPHTLPAHVSLFTGHWPFVHGLRMNGTHCLASEVVTLAEQMQDAGLRTAAFPAAAVLDEGLGLEQGFEQYFTEDIGSERVMPPQRMGERTVELFESWLAQRDADERWFAWLHFFEPHAPYTPPPDLRERFDSDYDAEIHHTDRLVGRVFDLLEARGELDTTLLCITSDHGEGLGDHREDTHGTFIYDSTMHVPLILSHPTLPARRVGEVVSLVDVAPTLCELMDVAPMECSGRSMLGYFDGSRPAPEARGAYLESYIPFLTYGWSPLESVVEREAKYIAAPRPELYDPHADPGETLDLASERPQERERLELRLQEFANSTAVRYAASEAELSPAELRRLQALGYAAIESVAPELQPPGRGAGIDPKDGTELLPVIQDLVRSQMLDDADAVAKHAFTILEHDPGNPLALEAAGVELCGAGNYERAAELLERLDARDRSTASSLLSLGVALLHLERLDEAKAALDRALQREPSNERALRWLAEVHERRGDSGAALEVYELLLENFTGPDSARRFLRQQIERLRGSG